MKAGVYNQYRSPQALQLVDVPKPTPRYREASVKVHATTVTIGDTIMRSFKLPTIIGWQKFMARLIRGWHYSRRHILGMELAGEIESIGRKVKRFKRGDTAFASTYGINFSGHAEYICLPENGVIAIKPVKISPTRKPRPSRAGDRPPGAVQTVAHRIPGGTKPALNVVKPL